MNWTTHLRTSSFEGDKKTFIILTHEDMQLLWKEHAKKCSEHLMIGSKETSSSLGKHGIYKLDEINRIIKNAESWPKTY